MAKIRIGGYALLALISIATSDSHAGKKVVRENLHMLTVEETKAQVLSSRNCEFLEIYSRLKDHFDEGEVKQRWPLNEKSLNKHGVFYFRSGNGFGGSRDYYLAFGESTDPARPGKAIYLELDSWNPGDGSRTKSELWRMDEFMPGELRVYEEPLRYFYTPETPAGYGLLKRQRNDGKLIGPDYVDVSGYIAILNCKTK